MTKTKIEWANENWNPIVGVKGGWGCNKVSPGCAHCYAEILHKRFGGQGDYESTEHKFKIKEHILTAPLKRTIPTTYFVCSTMDLFHHNVSQEMFDALWAVMLKCPQHRFMLLTKRPTEMKMRLAGCQAPNVWLGVSAETQKFYDKRVSRLLSIQAPMHFVSAEPLLGPIIVKGAPHGGFHQFKYPDWIIVGGESGPDARPMHPDWVRNIRDKCFDIDIAFFFKQWGAWSPQFSVGDDPDPQGRTVMALTDGRVTDTNWFGGPGPHLRGATPMLRTGKKKAGRLLDGAEFNGVPS